ncbi:MAG: hypothetical protein KDA42_09990 [Planctomycetales bacterium]|nr:hypothetical protein [Planctomycetales bacterium]
MSFRNPNWGGLLGRFTTSKVSKCDGRGRANVNRTRRRFARFESLESRELLAGDVSVAVVNGKLKLEGDGRDNAVEITAGDTSDSFVIRGLAQGAPTTVNGQDSVTVSNVTRKVKFKMGGGDDVLVLDSGSGDGLILPEQLKVFGHEGDDRVRIAATGGSRVKIKGDVTLDLGTGDDTVDVYSEGDGLGVVAKQRFHTIMGSGNDSVMFDAVGGTARVKVKGDTFVQLDGDDDNAVFTAHDDDTRIQLKGDLTINGGDRHDTIRLEALTENAQMLAYGKVNIITGSGNDRVRAQAMADNALISLMDDVDISTASGKDELLIDAIDGSARVEFGGAFAGMTGTDDDYIRVRAKDAATSIDFAGAALIDSGSSSNLVGDEIAVRAMTGSANVTFHGDATINSDNSLRHGNSLELRADADATKLKFEQDLSINIGNHGQPMDIELIARTGDAAILVDGNLKIAAETGDTNIHVESRFDNARIRVGKDASIQTGRTNDSVVLLTGADNTSIAIGDDLRISLGDEKDSLEITGVAVADNGMLNGEEDVDTFVDGGGNSFTTLQVLNFEV